MAETISKRRYGGVDPVERRSARRDRLIEAAIGLYGRQGYRNTGVRAVCQEAGLTERYFYESFVNSEALLAAAYDAVVARLLDALREAGGDDAPPVTLRAARMLESYFSTIRAHPAEARVFLIEITGVSPAIDDAIRHSLERFAELILDIHDAARAGPLAAEPLLRRGVIGGLRQIAIAWAEGEEERSLDEAVAAAMPLCLLACPIVTELRS